MADFSTYDNASLFENVLDYKIHSVDGTDGTPDIENKSLRNDEDEVSWISHTYM